MRLVVFKLNTGVDDGIAQGFEQQLTDRVAWYPDADGFLFGGHDLGNQLGSRQDKGVRAGQVFFHEPVGSIGDMGILADIGQIGAHERKRLVLWPFFQLDQLLDGFLVEKVTADTVAGIGWITDYRTVLEHFDNLFNQTELRVYRVDFKQHVVDLSFVRYSGSFVFSSLQIF